MKPDRLQALTDGVFAIAMTLLAFQIQIPHIAQNATSGQFWNGLHQVKIRAVVYAVSFIVLGVYWVAHHVQFSLVKRINLRFIWLNMLFLLFIGFVPFSADLLGNFLHQRIAILVYGTNLWLCSAVLYAQLEYAINNSWMVARDDISAATRRRIHQRIVGSPAFYVLGILASFVDTRISLFLFAAPPIFSLLPVGLRTKLLSRATS